MGSGQRHRVGPRTQCLPDPRTVAQGPVACLWTAGPDRLVLLLLSQTQFSEKPVQDRGLVVTDLRAEDVVLEHRSYCSAKARERHFAGDVLGYVTPVSRALGRIGRSRGHGGHWSPPSRAAAMQGHGERTIEQVTAIPWVFWGLVLHGTGGPVGSRFGGVSRALCPQLQAHSPVLHFLPVEQPWL